MRYKISNGYLEAEIIDLGAELCSLNKVNDSCEYIWQGDATYWKRHAPILFPIVGKLIDNKYIYDDISYEMNQHGFARDNVFNLDFQKENQIIFKLASNEKTLTKYPFEFELYLGYELNENSLEVSYRVVNKSDGEMLFSIGAHPAFNWPLGSEKKEDCYFEFKDMYSLNTLPISSEGILEDKTPVEMDGDRVWLNEKLFINDALVFDDLKTDYVSYKNKTNTRFVEMYFDGFPYVGLWSKPSGAPFVCIEPWCGIADFAGHNNKLEDKKGINILDKGGVFEASYIIKI